MICKFLAEQHPQFKTVIEPTCGTGSFIFSTITHFRYITKIIGVDINKAYLDLLKANLNSLQNSLRFELVCENFFNVNWSDYINVVRKPLLILGNLPWVTNSTLGALNSSNLPRKSNVKNLSGIDSITGKSNFDISEWMITNLITLINESDSMLAMICKVSVGRKFILTSWENGYKSSQIKLYLINAKEHFNVSVDVCLLVYQSTVGNKDTKTGRFMKGLEVNYYMNSATEMVF